MESLPPVPSVGSFRSPFAPDGYFVMLERALARKVQMQKAVAEDISQLQMMSTIKSTRKNISQLPNSARAYRILIRCAVLSATHLHEFYDIRFNVALSRIKELPNGAENCSAVVMHFIDLLIQTAAGAPTGAKLLGSEHYANAIETLVQSHLPVVRQTAVFWGAPGRVEDKRKKVFGMIRALRRLSYKAI